MPRGDEAHDERGDEAEQPHEEGGVRCDEDPEGEREAREHERRDLRPRAARIEREGDGQRAQRELEPLDAFREQRTGRDPDETAAEPVELERGCTVMRRTPVQSRGEAAVTAKDSSVSAYTE